ncbi:MAG: hypothetical protein K1X48_10755 [Burkholderiaceae bacterium]|nr:hypothetical protein [Burkholderiaceae bacterium]
MKTSSNPSDPGSRAPPPASDPLEQTSTKQAPGPKTIRPLKAAVPHTAYEWEEESSMTDGNPDPQVQQASQDLECGLQDTGRGPPSERAYQKQKK